MSINAHRLLAWLSPSFPTGAFAYSHGLEYAIAQGYIGDSEDLSHWLTSLLTNGSLWNEAVLFSLAYQQMEQGGQTDVAELALAVAGSKERQLETTAQGSAFARTVSAILERPVARAPLPVVVARAAHSASMTCAHVLPLFVHAQVANLVSAAVRMVPLGQTDGQLVMEGLFALIDRQATLALTACEEDLGSATLVSDIAAMCHETMQTRIFRT